MEEGEGGEVSLSQLEDQLQEVEEGESEDDEGAFLDFSGLKLGETPEVKPVSFPEQLDMGMSLECYNRCRCEPPLSHSRMAGRGECGVPWSPQWMLRSGGWR